MDEIVVKTTEWSELAEDYKLGLEKLGIKGIGKLKSLDEIKTHGGKLSIGLECLDRDLWDFDRAFETIKALGINRARIQSGWQKTERADGVYDFAWLDNVVDKLVGAGISPFLSLSYGNIIYSADPDSLPDVKNGGIGHIPVITEREREGWKNYVRATVAHFSDRVKYFEIWNEPDIINFCRCELKWTEAYMELVKMTSPIIREEAPDATVISCTAMAENIRPLIEMGLGDYVDVHSFHGYNAWPELVGAAQENLFSYIKAKAGHLKIWRGEAGYPSFNDPRSRGALHNVKVSEIKQAKFAARHIVCDMEMDFLDLTSYFHAYEFLHYMRVIRYYYGIIRHKDLSRKPSYHALQVISHVFDGEVKKSRDYLLASVWKYPEKRIIDDEKFTKLKLASFEKEGKLIFAYWLPYEIEDETVCERVHLSLPYAEGKIDDPVIIDTMTRTVYPIDNPEEFVAPVTDYPMLIVDGETAAKLCDIDTEVEKKSLETVIEQKYEG